MEFFRGNSDRIVQRVVSEYQAKRYAVDVIDGTTTTTLVRRAGYAQKFFSPHLAEYPAELKDAQGFWGVANLYFHTLGYNTKMVKPNEVPKTYEDLLNPRWKGQLFWSTGRGGRASLLSAMYSCPWERAPGKPTCRNSRDKISPKRLPVPGRF